MAALAARPPPERTAGRRPSARRGARGARRARGAAAAGAVEEYGGPDELSPEAAAAVEAQANNLAQGLPTPGEADFRLLNEILSCDSWESLQTRVRTAAVEGELSDKTLSALQQVMQQAVGRGEQEDPRVVSSLEQAGQLIQATLAQMQMPPAMQLLDQLLMLDPQSEAASIRENLQAAIGSGQVTAAESLQTVDGLMDMMEQQEVEIEKRIEEGTATDNPEEFQEMLNLVKARQEAKVRLASIKTVLKAIADEAS